MKLYVLASCYTDESGNSETRQPAIFKSLFEAQDAMQKEFEEANPDELSDTMDSDCYDYSMFDDKDRLDLDNSAIMYYKDGGMSYYEIYEVEVDL